MTRSAKRAGEKRVPPVPDEVGRQSPVAKLCRVVPFEHVNRQRAAQRQPQHGPGAQVPQPQWNADPGGRRWVSPLVAGP